MCKINLEHLDIPSSKQIIKDIVEIYLNHIEVKQANHRNAQVCRSNKKELPMAKMKLVEYQKE